MTLQAVFGDSAVGTAMRNVSRLVFLLLVVIVVGAAAFFATWDIPAPKAKIEKVLPDDRFPK